MDYERLTEAVRGAPFAQAWYRFKFGEAIPGDAQPRSEDETAVTTPKPLAWIEDQQPVHGS
jgi:hypothetical protein